MDKLSQIIHKIFRNPDPCPQSRIPFRLNFIFIIVGLLFAVLVGQLAYMQVLNGPAYKAQVQQSDNTMKTGNVQRGMIYDANGKLLVGNKSHHAITYTKGVASSQKQLYNDANVLSKYITVPKKTLTKNQKISYYLASPKNLKDAAKHVKGQKHSQSALLAAEKSYVEKKGIKFTKSMKNAAEIYTKMNGAYQLSTTDIKDDNVTSKELSKVGEHLSDMPGVEIGTSWSRKFPGGKGIQSLVGTVSNEKTGLPSGEVHQLTAEGYSRNDSVGQSFLEQEFEPTLRGTKSQTQEKVDGNKKVTKEVKRYGGHKGDNLQLTINGKFQKKLESLVKSADQSAGQSTGAYAVVMNPHNGDIYGMAGVSRNPKSGKLKMDDLGAINSDIVMGSVVKGAMVSGAFMDHVIRPGHDTLEDKPILVDGSQKSSWFNSHGGADIAVNAPTALEVSSNSYMMQLAMKEGHFHYHSGAHLNMSPSIFTKLRNYFHEFGLGIKTGIDLPGENSGLEGPSGAKNIQSALDESFGNYDAYTTIQIAQYMSTIANGGYRVRPHIVKTIRGTRHNGKLGTVKDTVNTDVLDEVPMTDAERKEVKQGLYQVVHGTNAYRTGMQLNEISPSISAKTGTAETMYKGHKTVTLSLASYAPSNHPDVVVALAIPNLPESAESNNINLAKSIYSAFWSDVLSKSTKDVY